MSPCFLCGEPTFLEYLTTIDGKAICDACRSKQDRDRREALVVARERMEAEAEEAARSDPKTIREQHRGQELHIQSVAMFYMLVGVVSSAFGLWLLSQAPDLVTPPSELKHRFVAGLILGITSPALVWMGSGLWRFRPWARYATTCCAVAGFALQLFNPSLIRALHMGLLLGYVLRVMLDSKSNRVFGVDYAQIIQATPEVKGRMPELVLAFWGFLLFGLIVAAVN